MVLGGAAGPRAVASFLPAAGLLVARLVGARISAAATAALTAAWDRAFGDDPQKGGGKFSHSKGRRNVSAMFQPAASTGPVG